MTTSYSAESELRTLAEELHAQAYELEKAADVLRTLRECDDMKERIESAKQWAKDWLCR